jgi:hypothetical protein
MGPPQNYSHMHLDSVSRVFGLVGPDTNLFDCLALIYLVILFVLDSGVQKVWSVVFFFCFCPVCYE